MRIIAGEHRGRTLKTPDGRGTRPTDARAREALFNILGERVVGATFLDMYAGSGSVGLEALSRGAASCLFVEQNAGATSVIKENVRLCGYAGLARVWHNTTRAALKRLEETNEGFAIVFADPPFLRGEAELSDLCTRLKNRPQLVHNDTERRGTLVIQHHWKAHPSFAPDSPFTAVMERRAGESALSFYNPES